MAEQRERLKRPFSSRKNVLPSSITSVPISLLFGKDKQNNLFLSHNPFLFFSTSTVCMYSTGVCFTLISSTVFKKESNWLADSANYAFVFLKIFTKELTLITVSMQLYIIENNRRSVLCQNKSLFSLWDKNVFSWKTICLTCRRLMPLLQYGIVAGAFHSSTWWGG